MIIDNSWYGHSKILADYAKLKGKVFYAAVSHCRELFQSRSLFKRLRYPGAKICVWSKLEEKLLHENGCMQAIAIGAPFLYLNQMLNEKITSKKTPPKGTIFFPVHGVPGLSINNHTTKLSKKIKLNFDEPITVSIPRFDPDFEEKRHAWESEGFRTISFGLRSDDDYLTNLINEILSHKTVTSDDMGSTAVQYGLYLGKRVAHWSGGRLIDNIALDRRYKNIIEEELLHLLSNNQLQDIEAQRAGAIILGAECLKTPSELVEIMGWNSISKVALAYLVQTGTRLKFGKTTMEGSADHKLWTPQDIQAMKEYENILHQKNDR